MATTFRSRVFRLLLLFAVVPSITLTLIGYYLTTDPLPTTSSESNRNELQDYFYDVIYNEIEQALSLVEQDDANQATTLDFVIRFDSSGQIMTRLAGALPVAFLPELHAAASQKRRGLVAVGDLFHQYASRPTTNGGLLVGGMVHDSTLAAVLESARQNTATRSAERKLQATYIGFLGLLFLLVTSIAIIAAYIFSARVSQNLAKPVIALSDAFQQIAKGDFDQRLTLSAEDEIGALIVSFNRMASQLDDATSRLAQTERVAAWRQVARRFAHELKNPLQPILVSLYRIEKQLSHTDVWNDVKAPLHAASEEVKHLTVLAERFSSLAKLPPPTIKRLDLNGLVTSTVELYREKLLSFDFRLNLPDHDLHLESDAGYLREALHNLLQNSIDACASGATIAVTVTTTDDTATIAVSDSGIGMDAPTLSSARLPYFTTKTKGNGLGLAIVERSMAELGGQLRVESSPGIGTTVSIILPRGEI